MMDSTSSNNQAMRCAMNSPAWHIAFLLDHHRLGIRGRGSLLQAKNIADSGPFPVVAFLILGGEWFPMWQSKTWNDQEATFRMFAIIGIVLLSIGTT
jgi:Predicted small integral membrane protein (DUF2165)